MLSRLVIAFLPRSKCFLISWLQSPSAVILCSSCFSHVQLFATLWAIACQAPLSMGFSRQEYWSRLLFPSPMTNLEIVLKSTEKVLPTKVHLVKAKIFPVLMYGCESWTKKKAEHQRIDAFELWCWRRLLRVPWTARRSNQSLPKETSLEYSLEGLMMKLKL